MHKQEKNIEKVIIKDYDTFNQQIKMEKIKKQKYENTLQFFFSLKYHSFIKTKGKKKMRSTFSFKTRVFCLLSVCYTIIFKIKNENI